MCRGEIMDGMLYRSDDNGFTPIGKVGEIPTITIGDETEENFPVMAFKPEELTMSFEIDLLKGYSKKRVRLFRESLGIDLVPLKFPRKKNRRKKRLLRILRKLIMEIEVVK